MHCAADSNRAIEVGLMNKIKLLKIIYKNFEEDKELLSRLRDNK